MPTKLIAFIVLDHKYLFVIQRGDEDDTGRFSQHKEVIVLIVVVIIIEVDNQFVYTLSTRFNALSLAIGTTRHLLFG